MQAPQIPEDEAHRLESLQSLRLLDTPVEERFERITRLVRKFYQMPMAALSLIDADRQWCKSAPGIPVRETDRSISFCGHTIACGNLMVVEDAAHDPRFFDNPLVTDGPNIRFYAGVPLHGRDEARVGTLCVMDTEPRLGADLDLTILQDLAALAEREFLFESPLNSRPVPSALASAGELLLDDVTGLWNWTGITRLLEETTHRLRLIGGQQSLAWLHVDYSLPTGTSPEASEDIQRQLAGEILRTLDYQDTAGLITGGQFLLITNDSEEEALITRLATLSRRLQTLFPSTAATLHNIRLVARNPIDGTAGVSEITGDLEQALPDQQSPMGTLNLTMNGETRQLHLLK